MTWPQILGAMVSGSSRSGVDDAAVLDEAALLVSMRRAGFVPPVSDAEPPRFAIEDEAPPYERGAETLLNCIETDERLAIEWCRTAIARGWRIPDPILPRILNFASTNRHRREALAPLLGPRGRWLANLNEQWGELVLSDDLLDEEIARRIWSEASFAGRRDLLKLLVQENRSLARELIESTWKEDGAKERAEFVEVAGGAADPVMADLLESALGDRSGEVRLAAATGLTRLPSHPLADEALLLAEEFVHFSWRTRIDVPEADDPRFERFGIGPAKAPATVEQRLARLTKLVGLIPPSHWDPSAEVVGKLPKDAAGESVREGWCRATWVFRDQVWATALVNLSVNYDLTPILPRTVQEEIATQIWREKRHGASWIFTKFALTDQPWSPAFTRAFMEMLDSQWRGKGGPLAAGQLLNAALYMDLSAANLPGREPEPDWASTVEYWQRILHLRRSIQSIPIRSLKP